MVDDPERGGVYVGILQPDGTVVSNTNGKREVCVCVCVCVHIILTNNPLSPGI